MSFSSLMLLYIGGMSLIVAEIFVPGAIIGTIGFIMVLSSLIVAFMKFGAVTGGTLTVVSAVMGFAIFQFALRRLSLLTEQKTEDGFVAVEEGLERFLGLTGVVETPLRPVGTARFEAEPLTVMTRGELVSRGALVTVIRVEGDKVVVKEDQAAQA